MLPETRTNVLDSQDILPNVIKVLDLILMGIELKNKGKPYQDPFHNHALKLIQPTQENSIERKACDGIFCNQHQKKRNRVVPQNYIICYSNTRNSSISCIQSISVRKLGRKYVKLVNACLQSRRFLEAAKLLWIVCQDVSDLYLFKATMLVFENLDFYDKDETVWNFHRVIQNLHFVDKKEVQLEYIIHGLRNSIHDVQRRATELISMKRSKFLRKLDILDPIFEAYRALLFYAEWCYANMGEVQMSQAKLSAENAILQFTKVIVNPGDWDIFVLNLCGMLQYCGRFEEIENILLKYVECNPVHVNAHIYLCTYLYNYDPGSKKLIEHLKILAESCPSDERVLWLIDKWSKTEKKLLKCFKLIFMFMDYPTNGKNIQAWKIFSNLLHQTNSKKNEFKREITTSFWNSRSRCWYWTYFNPLELKRSSEDNLQCIALKVDVLSYFEEDHKFVKKALRLFPRITELVSDTLEEPDKPV